LFRLKNYIVSFIALILAKPTTIISNPNTISPHCPNVGIGAGISGARITLSMQGGMSPILTLRLSGVHPGVGALTENNPEL
jgi:hypothetical protein